MFIVPLHRDSKTTAQPRHKYRSTFAQPSLDLRLTFALRSLIRITASRLRECGNLNYQLSKT